MPKTSNTENTGPSSGSALSFIVELTKCLSPILSARTTEAVNGLKKSGNLAIIKRVVGRLLDGKTVVPDCGYGHNGISLKALGWTYNKRGTPKIDPGIEFVVSKIFRTPMNAATIMLAPLGRVGDGSGNVLDVTISAQKPDGEIVTEFVVPQCFLDMREEVVFVSLASLHAMRDRTAYFDRALCSSMAQSLTLAVCTHFEGYRFHLVGEGGNAVSQGVEVSYSVFGEVPA